jgi:hypothetical protein
MSDAWLIAARPLRTDISAAQNRGKRKIAVLFKNRRGYARHLFGQSAAAHAVWTDCNLKNTLKNLASYLGVDGMAEEWWSTISQRSPFLT